MVETKQKILDYLQAFHQGTPLEISQVLGLTPANIRYHLKDLESNGEVKKRIIPDPNRVGRPPAIFVLSPRSRGENFSNLLRLFLKAVDNHAQPETLLKAVVKNFPSGEISTQNSKFQRWNKAVEILNQQHYHAAWEAGPRGPKILLHHCPYLDLPSEHPVLCELDCQILSELFDLQLTIDQKQSQKGVSTCIFQTRRET
jgi:predicted ArsR family transcriptional regulator